VGATASRGSLHSRCCCCCCCGCWLRRHLSEACQSCCASKVCCPWLRHGDFCPIWFRIQWLPQSFLPVNKNGTQQRVSCAYSRAVQTCTQSKKHTKEAPFFFILSTAHRAHSVVSLRSTERLCHRRPNHPCSTPSSPRSGQWWLSQAAGLCLGSPRKRAALARRIG